MYGKLKLIWHLEQDSKTAERIWQVRNDLEYILGLWTEKSEDVKLISLEVQLSTSI